MKVCILRKAGCSYETCKGILSNIKYPDVRLAKSNQKKAEADILIRWGSTACFSADFIINTPEMIHLASDKIETRKRLIQKNILVPRTFFTKKEALSFDKYPIIGRKRQHSQGENMFISHNFHELTLDNKSEYWSEFIPKDREFRVYIFFGRVLGVSEKIPDDATKIAWNKSLGNGVFKNLHIKEMPRAVGRLALCAAAVLDVDFSAVDIISQGNQHYVLEFNNTPECSPYRQFLFGRAFTWLIKKIEQNGEKPYHFEVPYTDQNKMVLLCKDKGENLNQ